MNASSFQSVLEALSEPALIVRREDHRVIWCNEALSEALSTPRETLIERPLRDLDPHWPHDASHACWGQLEVSLSRVDLDTISALIGRIQRPTRHRELFARAPWMIQVCDESERLLEVNPSWLEALGYDHACDVIGRSWLDFVPEPLHEALHEQLERDGEVNGVELALRRADGSLVSVLCSAYRDDERGEWVATLMDITERERAAAELRAARDEARTASRAKGTFLASMSHELRTPLNGILGYAQLLARSPNLPIELRRGVDTIQSCGQHLLSLINDILDLSRLEVQRLELDLAPFALKSFLGEVIAMTRVRAEQKGLEFRYTVVDELPVTVIGDPQKLRQVLLNLLSNAIKFTERGFVELRISRHDEDTIRFSVLDSGVGIPLEQHSEVFMPFHQLSPELKQKGAGLGLAISHELVSLMQGTLHLESRAGEGARFWFDLEMPVSTAVYEGYALSRRRVGFEGPSRTLLIVDDRWENRMTLSNLLEPLGFDLVEATDGAEAIERVSTDEPDAVLMDLVMPVLDGFSATRRLRMKYDAEELPVIAFSASVFETDREESLDAGCDAFLAKPVDIVQLLDTLGELLELAWRYDESEPSRPDNDAATHLLTAPPRADLEALALAAREGRIVRVRQELARIKARSQPEHQAFVEHLSSFVKHFQLQELCDFITSLGNPPPT